MPLNNIKQLLKDLGLSESEVVLYLAALQIGPSSVQDIAKSAGISRTAAYDLIEALQKRGLFSFSVRGKKKYFVAEEPQKLIAHFEREAREHEEKLHELKMSIQMLVQSAGGEKPVVKYFEGSEALYAYFQELFEQMPEEQIMITNYEEMYKTVDFSMLSAVRKKSDKLETSVKILHVGESKLKKPTAEYCRLPLSLDDKVKGEISVFNDTIAMVTFSGKLITVIIKSKQLASMQRVLLESMWGACSRIGR
ncbi:MAG: hypothetical protein ACD_76C00068G0024 [uncultured bacterium]|nr:MAG: hypothetical protein ACD_76C00068G0024 [uncultured bacterium]HBD05117.1 hypothetical protein [Candidatus Uhrbacteria bacterium]